MTADALYTMTTLVHTSSSVAMKSNLSDLSFRAILSPPKGPVESDRQYLTMPHERIRGHVLSR